MLTNIEENNLPYVAFSYIQPYFIVSLDEFRKLYCITNFCYWQQWR